MDSLILNINPHCVDPCLRLTFVGGALLLSFSCDLDYCKISRATMRALWVEEILPFLDSQAKFHLGLQSVGAGLETCTINFDNGRLVASVLYREGC